jgi:hypothetical protein
MPDAFTILTTVGFGDISAHAPAERVITVVVMLCGAYVFAIIMGNISSIIIEGNAAQQEFDATMTRIVKFCAHHGLSKDTRREMERYFEQMYPDGVIFDEEEILNSVPPTLRTAVQLDMYKGA